METTQTSHAEANETPGDTIPVAPFAVRWSAALIAVLYGCAKLTGVQFAVLDSELDKPLRDVDGFWLTWHYFGHSQVYKLLIAAAEIGGGLLLTVRRHALLGALLLLPVTINILVIDLFYNVIPSATMMALLLLILIVWVITPHYERLVSAIIPPWTGPEKNWIPTVGRITLLVGALALQYRIATVTVRNPTPVDGEWIVQSEPMTSGIEKVFFEYNRAHLAVMKDTAGEYVWHHFELEPNGRIRIWDRYLRKGELLYQGDYDDTAGRMTLRPADPVRTGDIVLRPAVQ